MGRRRKRRSKKRSKKKSLKIRRRPSTKKRRVRKKAKRRSPKRIRSKRRSKKRRSPKRIRRKKSKKKSKKRKSKKRRSPKRIRSKRPSATKSSPKKKPKKKKRKEKDEDFDDMEELDDYIEDDFLDDDVIEPDDIKGKKWKPSKVEDHVAKQWGKRFGDKDGFEPERLKVKVKGTARLDKYTDKKGVFDTDKYVTDVRGAMASRAKRRGFKGDALKALKRKGPQKIKPTKPKYGAAIDALKSKLGGIKYGKLIRETTDKLTGDVKPQGGKFKETGLSIIKSRNSEDGALPSSASQSTRNNRRAARRARRKARRAARRTNNP